MPDGVLIEPWHVDESGDSTDARRACRTGCWQCRGSSRTAPEGQEQAMSSEPIPGTEQPADALSATLKRTVLQQRSSSIPGREIVQVLTEIPPGVESGWHIHPGEEVGFILAGTVEMMFKDQLTLVLHAGDPFLIPPRMPHNALDRGPETGRMLSTYIVEVGQPLATFTQ
jgi:quercetin dioxygenase-like cupin family protein